jgi:hypothetical protein
MARKYTWANGQFVGYGMEECEERLLIVYFEQIAPSIRPEAAWPKEFFHHFYEAGTGVAESDLTNINRERRRKRLPEFEVIETQMGDYGKSADRSWKAQRRLLLRDQYRDLDTNARHEWTNAALEEFTRQPKPHYTFEEYQARTCYRSNDVLSERERAMRELALKAKDACLEAVSSVSKINERALRQIKASAKPETRDRIIGALSPDEALVLAECGEIEDEELIDKLVVRSMD